MESKINTYNPQDSLRAKDIDNMFFPNGDVTESEFTMGAREPEI